jgi:hypothetical protein
MRKHAKKDIFKGQFVNLDPYPATQINTEPCGSGSETLDLRASGHKLLISNSERFKPAFAERDRKQTMINLRGISPNWFKNQLCSSPLGFHDRGPRTCDTGHRDKYILKN